MSSARNIAFVSLHPAREQRRMPWKNGQGFTREICIFPEGASLEAGDFAWRLSSAEIGAPGAFSSFPGHQRLLGLMQGELLELEFSGKQRRLYPGEVLEFAGEEAVSCAIPAGPVVDIGLIFQRGVFTGALAYLKFGARLRSFEPATSDLVLLVAKGGFAATVYPGEQEFGLSEGDALRIGRSSEKRLIMLAPDAPGDALWVAEMDQRSG
jgi:environmental stress-induced protein Ves